MSFIVVQGDARQIPLADASVQCVVTSPPFFGLRDYGTATWKGGDTKCDHSPATTPQRRGLASSTLSGGKGTTGHQQEGYRNTCGHCGAIRIDNQLGLEPTPDCRKHGLFRLRKDLTEAQQEYVVRRLLGVSVLDVQKGDKDDKE